MATTITALPPGWTEVEKDYYEHESGAVVHRSAAGRVKEALTGEAEPVKWRAHISKRYDSMLPDLFDSKEAAFLALAPKIEARNVRSF